MAKKDDPITSTEKLLELIRGKKSSGKAPKPPPVPTTAPPKRPSSLKKPAPPSKKPDLSATVTNLFSRQQRTTIGVSVGYADLKMVKVSRTSDKSPVLLDYKAVLFPPQVTLESAQFPMFLKRVLTQFCRNIKDPEIWSAISSAKVEMRYLRIPKVPRKQISTTIYWTFKRDVSFDEKQDIFDFAILGDALENGIRRTEVMAYTAPRAEVNQLNTAFSKAGFPLTGVTIVPFLIQNLLRGRWLEAEGKNVCTLYIGRDWSRIDIFSKGNLILSRGIKAGMKSMVESVRQQTSEPEVDALTPTEEEPEPLPEVESIDVETLPGADEARRIFYSFVQDPQFDEGPPEHHFAETDIFRMILPALERLVRQVDRTLGHFALKFDKEGVDGIYISGPVNTQPIIVDYIGEALGLKIDLLDPMGVDSPISREISPPKTRSEREAFLPAVGLAMSDREGTPNFIYTYKEKNRSAKSRQINTALFAGLLFIIIACGAVFLWQSQRVDNREMIVEGLQRELDGYFPRVDQQLIANLLEQVKKRQNSLKSLSHRYKTVAVINEVSRLTPGNIRLVSVTVDLAEKDDQTSRSLLRIEGVVFGDRLTFESGLAEYLVKLETSPLLKDFNIRNRSFAFVNENEVMRFSAQLEIA